MNYYHNNFDAMYRRPAKQLAEAIEVYIEDSLDNSPGSRVLEDLQAKQNAQTKVLMAIVRNLDPVTQAKIAADLRIKPAHLGDAD